MEIERKFLLKQLPDNYSSFPAHLIEQAYLNASPVVRIRRADDTFYLTYKGKGLMAREEYNLPLTEESYCHLLEKRDGKVITKKRYLIPLAEKEISPACLSLLKKETPDGSPLSDTGAFLVMELDVFEGELAPLVMAEIEFPSVEAANAFTLPSFIRKEVTNDPSYHNVNMALS